MTQIAIWHGTDQESIALLQVLENSCMCRSLGSNERRCPAHAMLMDQRVLDGLLFMRRMVERLMVEEFAELPLVRAGSLGATAASLAGS